MSIFHSSVDSDIQPKRKLRSGVLLILLSIVSLLVWCMVSHQRHWFLKQTEIIADLSEIVIVCKKTI